MKSKRLSIALMGTRGVPAKFGGYKTFVDEECRGLADKAMAVRIDGLEWKRFKWGETNQLTPLINS